MSKGGGSTQTAKVEIPKWLEDAAQANIARAKQTADIGYVPNYGLDVAAFSPLQQQGMQATGMGAQAFGFAPQGFDATAGIPTPETVNGFTGYRSGNLFDEAMQQLATRRPAQYVGMQGLFTDPVTGAASLPTALDTIYNPESSDAQINALMGSTESSSGVPDNRNALERYVDARNYMYDMESGQRSGLSNLVGSTLLGSAVINPLVQASIDKYEQDNFWRTGNAINAGAGDGELSTNNYDLAQRTGITYVPPPPTVSPATYVSLGGDQSNWSTGSDGRSYGTSYTGTPSGNHSLGAGGGNTAGGYSFGGW